MKHTALLALAAVVVSSSAAYAQTNPHSIIMGKTSAADSLILKKNRPEGPHEIPVPKFVVKSANNNFMMTIGGQINPIIGADLGNDLYNTDAGINFVTQNIPVPSTEGHRSDFYINPLNAALDFTIVGLAGTPNEITGYIKLATNGNNAQINLNKAYISYRGFTMGKKSTLFQDGTACQPPTIDPEGPCGMIANTVYELGYKSPNYNGFQYSLGIDIPSWYSSNGVYRGKDYPEFDGKQTTNYGDATQVVPDIPMWVQYGTSDYNRVRVSGIIRNFAYRDLLANKTRHKVGWGVMLSGNANPVEPLILYATAAYGQGIGAYLQDIAGMPLSFTPQNDNPGHMDASPMMGVTLGATYNINSKWQVNAMCSESRIWDVADYARLSDSSNYKYALYAAGNVFYNVTNYFQVGLEYVWGRKVTWDHTGANDSRIQAQFMFTL